MIVLFPKKKGYQAFCCSMIWQGAQELIPSRAESIPWLHKHLQIWAQVCSALESICPTPPVPEVGIDTCK